jgi:DnaJ-class molecular chaperone
MIKKDRKRYNRYKNTMIYLKEDEKFCKKCDGKGSVSSKNKYISSTSLMKRNYLLVCDICFGHGKLDWVEQVTGKIRINNGDTQYDPTSK